MNDQERLLLTLFQLQSSTGLTKKEIAQKYKVSEKTIQRDLALLRNFLEDHVELGLTLHYDTKRHTNQIKSKSIFSKKEILVIAKILLESRALSTNENKQVLEGLLALVDKESQDEIRQIIASERLNYQPTTANMDQIDLIWALSDYIRHEQVIQIDYQQPWADEPKSHVLLPVSIYFDRFYFYLVAYNLKHKKNNIFRVDRVKGMRSSDQPKPFISRAEKYRDGDERYFKADASQGRKIRIKAEYYSDPSYLLDVFPKAKLGDEIENGRIVSFEAQDTGGLERWIMGQGQLIKILSPISLVKKIKENYENILEIYKKPTGGR